MIALLVCLPPARAYAACTGPTGNEGEFFYNQDFKIMQFCDGTNWNGMGGGSTGGSGITDGNKGDLTVSGAGATWVINPASVQYSKIQNVTSSVLLGRYAATGGTMQEITLGSGLSLNSTTGVLSATGSLSGSGAAGYVPYWSSATALAYDNTAGGQFFWDATNHRLGIGLAAPTQALDVAGKITGTALIIKPITGAAAPTGGSGSSGIQVKTTTQRDAIASPAVGMTIYNTTTSQLEVYNGSAWVGVGGMTGGTIAAFALTSCPSGWTEYTAARGRFLRGIDPSGSTTVDPDGTRTPGNLQVDDFKSHTHNLKTEYGNYSPSYPAPNGQYNSVSNVTSYTNTVSVYPAGGAETRPKNVAVIFCQYGGSAVPGTITASGTTNYVARWTNSTVLGTGSIYDSGTNVGIGTTSPAEVLEVNGNIKAALLLTSDGQFKSDRIQFSGSQYYVLNGSSVGVKLANGATAWSAQSDRRLKDHIVPILANLAKVQAINPVYFQFKKDPRHIKRVGVIAQDVQSVLPEIVETGSDGYLSVRYTELVPVLIGAVKELKADNDNLRTEFEAYKKAHP